MIGRFSCALAVVAAVVFVVDFATEATILVPRRPDWTTMFVGSSAVAGGYLLGRRRDWRVPSIVVSISLVVALVIVELSLRGVVFQPDVPESENQLAGVAAPPWLPVAAGATRPCTIVGIGDSFGWGAPNYFVYAEAGLRRLAPAVGVANLSLPRLDLHQESVVLRRFAPGRRPRIVVHGVFVGNDFTTTPPGSGHVMGTPVRAFDGLSALRPGRFVSAQWVSRWVTYVREIPAKVRQWSNGQPVGLFSEGTLRHLDARTLAQWHDGVSPRAWEQVKARLEDIRSESSEMGAAYVMLVHPERTQVDVDRAREIGESLGWPFASIDLEEPQRLLAEYCRERGLQCIDLLPELRREKRAGVDVYRAGDTHYSRAGHQIAARALVGTLVDANEAVGDPLEGWMDACRPAR